MKHKDLSDIQQSLEEKGLPAEGLVEHIRGRKRTRASNNNKEDDDDDDKMELGMLIYIDYVVDKYIYIYFELFIHHAVDNNDNNKTTSSRSKSRAGSHSRTRSSSAATAVTEYDTPQDAKRARSKSVMAHYKVRTQSSTHGTKEGSVAPSQMKQVDKSRKSMERGIVKYARGGEADRRHYPKLVKHLNSGKRSLGTSTIGR